MHYPVVCPSEKAVNDLGYFLGDSTTSNSEHVVDRARIELSKAIRLQEPQQTYDSSISHTMSIDELKRWQQKMYEHANIGATEAVANVKAMLDKLTCRKTCLAEHGTCDYPYESKRRLLEKDCLRKEDGKCIGQPNRIRSKRSIVTHVQVYGKINEKELQRNVGTIEEKLGQHFQSLVSGSSGSSGSSSNAVDWTSSVRILRSMNLEGEQTPSESRRHDVPLPKERAKGTDVQARSIRGRNFAVEEEKDDNDNEEYVSGIVATTSDATTNGPNDGVRDLGQRDPLVDRHGSDAVDESAHGYSMNEATLVEPTHFPALDLSGSALLLEEKENAKRTITRRKTNRKNAATVATAATVASTNIMKLRANQGSKQQRRRKGFIGDLVNAVTSQVKKDDALKGVTFSMEIGLPTIKTSEIERVLYILQYLCENTEQKKQRDTNSEQRGRRSRRQQQDERSKRKDLHRIQQSTDRLMSSLVHTTQYTMECPTDKVIEEPVKMDLDTYGHGLDGRVKCRCELGWDHAPMTASDALDLSPFSKRLIGCDTKVEDIEKNVCERTCNATRGTCQKVYVPEERRAPIKVRENMDKRFATFRGKEEERRERKEREEREERERKNDEENNEGNSMDQKHNEQENNDVDENQNEEEEIPPLIRIKNSSIAPLSEYQVIACWPQKPGCLPLLSRKQPMTKVVPFRSYTFGSTGGDFGVEEKVQVKQLDDDSYFSIFKRFNAVVLGLYQLDDHDQTVWARVARTHAMEESMTEEEKLLRQQYRKWTPDGDLGQDLFINLDTVGPVVETDFKHWWSLSADERRAGKPKRTSKPWWWGVSQTSAPTHEWRCECLREEGWKNGIGTNTSSPMDAIDPLRCDALLNERDWCGLAGGQWMGSNEDDDSNSSHLNSSSSSSSSTPNNTSPEFTVSPAQSKSLCDMLDASLVGRTLDGASFMFANWTGKDLTGASFKGSNLTGAVLNDATVHHVDFRGAMLDGTQMVGVHGQLAHCPNLRQNEDNNADNNNADNSNNSNKLFDTAASALSLKEHLPTVFLDNNKREWICVNKYLVGPGANLKHAQIRNHIHPDMLKYVLRDLTAKNKTANTTSKIMNVIRTPNNKDNLLLPVSFLEKNEKENNDEVDGNQDEVKSVVSQIMDNDVNFENMETVSPFMRTPPPLILPQEASSTTTPPATTNDTDDTLDILRTFDVHPRSAEFTDDGDNRQSTMADVNRVSHLLHLDLPLPMGCNMSMGLNHTEVDASGRPHLILKHLSPQCGCTKEVRAAASLLSTKNEEQSDKISTTCRSALTHYAWGVGCHSMATLYHSTCTRYKVETKVAGKKTGAATAEGSEGSQGSGRNSHGSPSSHSSHSSQGSARRTKSFKEIAHFLTNKMPSFARACDYLSQLVHFRCISQTTLSSTSSTAKIAEAAGKLVQPTGRQRLPLTIQELLMFTSNETENTTSTTASSFRFKEEHLRRWTTTAAGGEEVIQGTAPGDFVRFRVVKRMTQRKRQTVEEATTIHSQYASFSGFDDLPKDGAGGGAPLWIKPMSREPKEKKKINKKSKLIKNEGLVFEWLRQDKVCTVGKGPEPKRSFTMTPLSDGFTHVVFGGIGLDGGGKNARKNDIPHVLIAGNMRLEAKIYNETHLLLPMNGLSTTAYASAGVSYDGVTCPPSGPVPVPPNLQPDEPLRPN